MENRIQDLAVRAQAGDAQALHDLMGPTYTIAYSVVEGRIGKNDAHPSGGRCSAWDVPWKVVSELVITGGIRRVSWTPTSQSWEAYVRRRTWLRMDDALSGGDRIADMPMAFDADGFTIEVAAAASEEPEVVLLKREELKGRHILATAALRLIPSHQDQWAVREIYLLKRGTYAQAAAHLGCPEGTLKARLSRLFKRIAEELRKGQRSDGGEEIAPAVA